MRRWLAKSVYRPTLAYNYLMGRVFRVRRWWDRIDENLIIGALPFRADAQQLKALGVTGVVNLCEEYPGPTALYEQLEIEHLWLPTIDFHHPSSEYVQNGAEFIERHAQRGGCTYVHCKAGRARSATIVLWWLVRFREMTPEAAQALMLQARPHINPRIHLRPVIQELYSQLAISLEERLDGAEAAPLADQESAKAN